MVNQIVKEYYQIEASQRSTYTVLLLIDKYKNVMDINLFESTAHYYCVLAKVSDRLLQLLSNTEGTVPPLFFLEKSERFVEILL